MKRSIRRTLPLIGWLLLGFLAGGQKLLAQQASIDQAYVDAIRAHTTDERFLPQSLLSLPQHPTVPSPLEHFGHIIGSPGELHRLQEIYGYYEALAAASPHVQLQDMGETEEGRRFLLVVIGDAATLERLPHYKQQLAKLADPRSFPAEQLPAVLDDSKLVYYVNGGMHATETGSPEMLMELAYRLAIDDAPDIKQIREGIITVINPVSEPDGLEKQVEWYHRYTKQREVYDDGFPRSPPYWGKYVFHDNNRDGLQISQRITQSIFQGFFEFHPPVMLDLHESVPLLYVSTGTGPYNDYVDPITVGEWQVMANHDIATVAGQGMPGAWHWGFYDGWYPGYGIWVANNHNATGRFYETYGNAGANTYLRDLSSSRYAGDPATSKEWYRPDPPTQELYWSFRNNINYTMVGVLASLHYGATNARQLLHNFYKKGLNSLEKGRKEGPRAFRIAKEQRDPAMAAYLAAQLQKQGIEVHENASDYVLLSEQPYRNLLVSLLTPQAYPKEAKFPPYDAIAWTLPLLYGVEVEALEEWESGTQGLQRCTEPIRYAATVEGSGRSYLIAHQGQQNLLGLLYAAREQHKNARFHQLTQALDIAGQNYPAGSLWIENVPAASMENLASRWELDVRAGDFAPEAALRKPVQLPRVAIYHTWFNTQDEGWSRFTLEQRGIPFVNIDKDDLRKGGLKERFDVILMPRVRGNASTFIHGVDKRFGPLPYTATKEFPSHGFPASTPDMTGGPGFQGMEALMQFVERGGLLISLDNMTGILLEAGFFPDHQAVDAGGLFHPGSLVQAMVRADAHPLFNGYGEYPHLFRGNAPLMKPTKYKREQVLLQYGTQPLKEELPYEGEIWGAAAMVGYEKAQPKIGEKLPYVLSGMVRNEDKIIGHSAVSLSPMGKGRVLGFTFDPLHRHLNQHDAGLVWNALLHWDSL